MDIKSKVITSFGILCVFVMVNENSGHKDDLCPLSFSEMNVILRFLSSQEDAQTKKRKERGDDTSNGQCVAGGNVRCIGGNRLGR